MLKAQEDRSVVGRVVAEVSRVVEEMAGVQLGPKQASMVESRLRTRMQRLALADFGSYLDHLNRHREEESQALLSLMTTHHTFFFREFAHFEYLQSHVLAGAVERARRRGDRKIRVWSAACSRGQEAYSLAMFFHHHLAQTAPDVDYEIWATDIDPESVGIGRNGVYKIDELKQVPVVYSANHWIRGKGAVSEYAKVRDALKSKVRFATANLLEPEGFLGDKMFDVVFCRNVYIYFNREQIRTSASKILKNVVDGGFLFLGVSESIAGLELPVESQGSSIHRRKAAGAKAAPVKEVAAEPAARAPLRVLCVDDSPTIHGLLKKILVAEHGFRIVHGAMNGKEALEWLKTGQADLMTLDIEMPQMDGPTFLKTCPREKRPPVLVLSSLNRDDSPLGGRMMGLGAFDYVEKPSLQNLAQAGNEIRAKLRLAMGAKDAAGAAVPAAAAKRAAARKKVLVVDDSATIRQLLRQILSADPELELVAEAARPSEVEGLIEKHKPDVITLDIHMPEMDGVTLLKKIFPKYGIPTVMISSISREEGTTVLQALESGAVDYVQKPSTKEMAVVAPEIRERVKTAASSTRAVKRQIRKAQSRGGVDAGCVVLLGSSTGGTEALRHVFCAMPAQIPPTLVVQHIPAVFSAAFASRLNDLCPFEVKEAADGDEVKANRVLIAPGGKQMGLARKGKSLIVRITDDAPVNRHKPSVDYLFKTAADLQLPSLVAAVLTGMGADGARQLKVLRDRGARTIAQDEASSVVYGMPREAKAMGGAEFVESLDGIADLILKLVAEQSRTRKAG